METAFTRELAASKASAGLARTLVISHLLRWGASEFIDRAVPVVSELTNNAIRVSEVAGSIYVHASLKPVGLWLGVSDTSPQTPVQRETVGGTEDIDSWEEENFGGWGLQIVQSCSDRFWIEPAREGHKWVCAELRYSREAL